MAVKAQFIAGQWLPGSGATMSKLAPEDQSLLWQAASAGADDVQAACAAAQRFRHVDALGRGVHQMFALTVSAI